MTCWVGARWQRVSTASAWTCRPGPRRSTTQGEPNQFAYDNGEWYLHIGDTGYRYLTATEPEWQAYIDQAVQMGATKVRAWFCQARSDVQILFGETRTALNLSYWQEIDRRLVYALERHPHIQFKLIL